MMTDSNHINTNPATPIESFNQPEGFPTSPPNTPITTPSHNQFSHKRNVATLIPVLLLLIAGMGAVTLSLQKTQDTRSRATVTGPALSLTPANKIGEVGEMFTLGVTMNTDTDTVSAAELHLSYDPTAIQILSFTPGTVLPVVLTPETHTNGVISVTLGAQPTSPFKGDGIVGTWTIKILAAKQSSLGFADYTQVAALEKNTNALVSSIGSNITGTAITESAPTPTPTTPSQNTPFPIPTKKTFGNIVSTIATPVPGKQTLPDSSISETSPPKISKITIFDQIFIYIVEFFLNLFQKQ